MKKKLSLTEKISLAENNAVDFMHACVTIALHDEYEVGVQRLRKVNLGGTRSTRRCWKRWPSPGRAAGNRLQPGRPGW